MAKVPERKGSPEYLQIIVDIVALERRAHDLGFHETAHKLNNASQTIGWEIERKIKEPTQ